MVKNILTAKFVINKPNIVELDLTTRCNARCKNCTFRNINHGIDIDKNLAVNIIKEVKSGEIRLTGGGEPFLYTHLPEVVSSRFSKSKELKVSIFSNGILDQSQESLLKNTLEYVDTIRISLNTTNATEYFKLHGVNGFNNVMWTLQKIADVKDSTNSSLQCGLSFLICKDNKDELEDIINLAKKYNFTFVLFKPLRFHNKQNLTAKYDRIDKIEDQILKLIANHETNNFKIYFQRIKYLQQNIEGKKINCDIFKKVATIGADGYFYPCCYLKYKNDFKYRIFEVPSINWINAWKSFPEEILSKLEINTKECSTACKYIDLTENK